MACGDQTQWDNIHIRRVRYPETFTPCDIVIDGVIYRPDRKRWYDPVDPVKEFGEPREGSRDYFQERLMEFYRNYPDKPEYLYHYDNEQQTKEAMTKFKKGDRVRVANRGNLYCGSEGVVMEIIDDNRVQVRLNEPGAFFVNRVFMEWHLEHAKHQPPVDQPLSTTPDKVLQAAKTSPQAKDALKALFPDVFKESGQPFEFGWSYAIPCNNSNHPLSIGIAGVPFSPLEGRCLVMDNSLWEMKTQQYNGRTVLTFHKKP